MERPVGPVSTPVTSARAAAGHRVAAPSAQEGLQAGLHVGGGERTCRRASARPGGAGAARRVRSGVHSHRSASAAWTAPSPALDQRLVDQAADHVEGHLGRVVERIEVRRLLLEQHLQRCLRRRAAPASSGGRQGGTRSRRLPLRASALLRHARRSSAWPLSAAALRSPHAPPARPADERDGQVGTQAARRHPTPPDPPPKPGPPALRGQNPCVNQD